MNVNANISISLLHKILKRTMRYNAQTKLGGGGDGDDPNKPNWNWLNDKMKATVGEGSTNTSDVQKIINQYFDHWKKEAEKNATKQKQEIDVTTSGLQETLKNFDINLEKLRLLSKQYQGIESQINEVKEDVKNKTENLSKELTELRNDSNSLNENINNKIETFMKDNETKIVELEKAFNEKMTEQSKVLLEKIEANKVESSEELSAAINNLRNDIDDIVLRSISTSIGRVMNFILTFGGLFDVKTIGIAITFVITASIGIYVMRYTTITQSQTNNVPVPEVNTPNTLSITLPIQQENTQAQESKPVPVVIYPPDASILKTALLNALNWLNSWIVKTIEKIQKKD